MRERREVVIVGGGPAGAAAALLLARAGHDVLLLERAAVPRPKACGDCLSAQATRVLARLDVLAAVEAMRPARLRGWRIVAANGPEFTALFADIAGAQSDLDTALALPRDRLDAALLACAARAGAEIRTGAQVLGTTTHRRGVDVRTRAAADAIEARLVVGADGLRSVVGRSIGAVRRPARLRKVSLTAHVKEVAAIDHVGEMHVAPGACIGLAPVDDTGDSVNATLVVTDAAPALRASAGKDREARLSAFFDAQCRRFPALRNRIPALTGRKLHWLASGPFDRPVRTMIDDGVALVGDAAGYYDPFTGQGIHQALVGAEQLALYASAALRRGGPIGRERLAPYAAAHAALTRGSRRVQRMIEAVLSHSTSADGALRLLARSFVLRTTLLGVIGDVLPPRVLLDPRCLAACMTAITRPT